MEDIYIFLIAFGGAFILALSCILKDCFTKPIEKRDYFFSMMQYLIDTIKKEGIQLTQGSQSKQEYGNNDTQVNQLMKELEQLKKNLSSNEPLFNKNQQSQLNTRNQIIVSNNQQNQENQIDCQKKQQDQQLKDFCVNLKDLKCYNISNLIQVIEEQEFSQSQLSAQFLYIKFNYPKNYSNWKDNQNNLKFTYEKKGQVICDQSGIKLFKKVKQKINNQQCFEEQNIKAIIYSKYTQTLKKEKRKKLKGVVYPLDLIVCQQKPSIPQNNIHYQKTSIFPESSYEENNQVKEFVFDEEINFNQKNKKIPQTVFEDDKKSNKDIIEVYGLVNMGNTCYFNSAVQLMMHCLDIIEWKNNKSNTLIKLLELKNSINLEQLNENLLSFFKSLEFNNKENSKTSGNDPVRVISSIISQSQAQQNKIPLNIILNFITFGIKDYEYWARDNSDISFLFQSVVYQGYWCPDCKNTDLQNEEQRFSFNISTFQFQNSIEESIKNMTESNVTEQTCGPCKIKKKVINGFIKLPQFLYVNLDEHLMAKAKIENTKLIFTDQLRQEQVFYDQVGFICHPTFHYTYVRKQKGGTFLHFNDSYVSNKYNQNQYPIKGILYSCSGNPDPNIKEFTNSKNELKQDDHTFYSVF